MIAEPLLWANLDFEYELAGADAQKVQDLTKKWRHILRLLPSCLQARCWNGKDALPEKADLLPWGVDQRAFDMAGSLNSKIPLPPPEVVKIINDKRYSHFLEKEFQMALPYSQILTSCEGLERAVKLCPFDWVLKHPMGVSGREKMLGRCGVLSDSALGWAKKRWRKGWSLLFEPWVEKRRERSLHFQLEPDGQVRYLGHCQLATGRGGVHRGNRVIHAEPSHLEVFRACQKVAKRVAKDGYWGPLSIDTFAGVLGDRRVVRPLVELNGRYSFGRLTLALAPWIPPSWSWYWWHPGSKEKAELESVEHLPSPRSCIKSAGVFALPEPADPDRETGSYLMIASSPRILKGVERYFFSSL